MELKDKVVIVTGAGAGIGEGIARVCAREGASIMVMDRNREGAQRVASDIVAQGGKAISFAADVSRSDEVVAMVAETRKQFGAVDVLVNNAGIIVNAALSLHEIEETQWDAVMGVNVKGVYLCSKAVLPLMIERKQGKIVNIASISGIRLSAFGGIDYTTSKAAVLGLTRHLAWEVAPHGINVNAVCPGLVVTDIVSEAQLAEVKKLGASSVPLGRTCTTEEIAEGVVFLAGKRSAMVTGQELSIDGGSLLGWGEEVRKVILARKQAAH